MIITTYRGLKFRDYLQRQGDVDKLKHSQFMTLDLLNLAEEGMSSEQMYEPGFPMIERRVDSLLKQGFLEEKPDPELEILDSMYG